MMLRNIFQVATSSGASRDLNKRSKYDKIAFGLPYDTVGHIASVRRWARDDTETGPSDFMLQSGQYANRLAFIRPDCSELKK